jgi:hypothetical protein
VLPDITKAINESVCRVTGMRPIDVNRKNAQDVREKVYGDYIKGKKKPNLLVGDKVRIALSKKIFDRGFYPNFTDQIYTIVSASRHDPNVYRIKDFDEKVIKGRYYADQLQKVTENKETTYRIEKIIRKRKIDGIKQIFVKFIGYPNPEWIDEHDIVN